MNIAVVGTGYVGLVSGACLADIGHTVTCIDIDEQKIENLRKGMIPIFEPGLETVVKNNVAADRLRFTTDLTAVLSSVDVVFIAVGTPPKDDGSADLQYVYAVAEQLGKNLGKYTVIVNKSTVPVGTGREVEEIIRQHYSGEFDVVSCPEFLREGSAVEDFMKPDRIVVGARSDRGAKVLLDVFAPTKGEKLVTSVESAELIKYASNAFLATKISFINEIAHICERTGADIEEVAYGVGLDDRIGPRFLHAGIGWGGSCFPKDVHALDQIGGVHGYDFKLLKAVIEVNNHQRRHLVDKIQKHFGGDVKGKTFGILGLAFKANTDDVRESAAIDIVSLLREKGAIMKAFDFHATENARQILGDEQIEYVDSVDAALQGVDAAVITAEWPQFRQLNWGEVKEKMGQPILFDGRNMLNPKRMREEHGFTYYGIGRPDIQ
jgi:UDPglucose 6-dehydrogenase